MALTWEKKYGVWVSDGGECRWAIRTMGSTVRLFQDGKWEHLPNQGFFLDLRSAKLYVKGKEENSGTDKRGDDR